MTNFLAGIGAICLIVGPTMVFLSCFLAVERRRRSTLRRLQQAWETGK
jgi:hypothetical protein